LRSACPRALAKPEAAMASVYCLINQFRVANGRPPFTLTVERGEEAVGHGDGPAG
jgi:hypothetical protein